MANSKQKWAVFGAVLAGAAGYLAWANRRLFTVNDVTTGESASYPHLRSRVYYAEPASVLETARLAIRGLKRWRTVFIDMENGALEAEVETAVGHFLDDVTVYAVSLGHGQARAIIRSRSRVGGGGDLGQNAAHIRELQAAMDDRLSTNAAF